MLYFKILLCQASPIQSPLSASGHPHHLMLKMRQRSPWQPQPSKAVAANPQELTQLLLLLRGFYQQHQCPRILPKQAPDLLFIQPEEENKPSYSS